MTDIDRLKAALDQRYTVERELGAGGMATVYLAHDTKHHRKVAVKVLRPELAASLGAERFHREIEVAAQLQHPHILPLLDSGEAEGVLYYMMPFIEGESLRDRLSRQGELPVHEAVRLLTEIVDALAHAHGRGVVHRDIKPDNIMLSGRHALVMDFGVAKAVSEATGRHKLTSIGIALGTPAYMAPEQATADPQIDHRVDIYAVGCLAYELLTGHTPFSGMSPQETLAAHITTAPEAARKRRATISPALNDVVMKCLEKRPADRWQSAEELLAHLEPLMTPSTGMTPAQTRPSPAIPRARSPLIWFVAGAAIIAATAFGVSMMTRGGGPAFSLGRAQPLAIESALEIEPTLSPDGRHVAYAAGNLSSMRIFVRQPGGRAIPITTDSASYQRGPVWSPDGSQLMFIQIDGDRGAVMVAPALGGTPRPVLQRAVASYSWSPDGESMAFVVGESLFVKPLEGGAPRSLTGGATMFSPSWSPDGRHIAYVVGDPRFATAGVQFFGNIAPTRIRTVPVAGGDAVDVTDGQSLDVSPVWTAESNELLFVSGRDGPRDVYAVAMSGGKPKGTATRVTSGLNPHSISLSADGSRIAYSAYIARSNIWQIPLKPGGVATMANARQVTTGNQLIEGVSVSADGQSLLYDSDRDGRTDVYRIGIAGGEPQRITTDPASEFNPSESPDGRWVTFHSFKYGQRDIFVVPRDGGEMIRLTSDSAHDQFPHWSPDGNAISYFRHGVLGRFADAFIVRRQTDGSWGKPEMILDQAGPPGWLSDSTIVMLRRDFSLATMSVRGGEVRPFYRPAPGQPRPNSAVARDGAIFIRDYERGGASTFWRIARAGATPQLIARLDDPNRPATRSEFDIDGRFLYTTIADRQSDIYVAELVKR